MIGEILMGGFGYGFGDAMVQMGPGERPQPAKMLQLVDESGLVVKVSFLGAEQWKEFQRQVAEEKPPSEILIADGGTLPRTNGHKLL